MDEQGRWLARLLEASLQSSGLSEREVEERLGWKPGEIGRMLDGSADCGPLQLLAVLAELGSERATPPFPQRRERGTQVVQELMERFRRLGYGPPGAAPAVAVPVAPAANVSPTADEIEKTVEDVLQRTFGDLRKGKRGGG